VTRATARAAIALALVEAEEIVPAAPAAALLASFEYALDVAPGGRLRDLLVEARLGALADRARDVLLALERAGLISRGGPDPAAGSARAWRALGGGGPGPEEHCWTPGPRLCAALGWAAPPRAPRAPGPDPDLPPGCSCPALGACASPAECSGTGRCARAVSDRSARDRAARAIAGPHTCVGDVALEWERTRGGWRLHAYHAPRAVDVRLPGEQTSRPVPLRAVRASGPELDLDGVERDRGSVARAACAAGCEHALRLQVLRRAAGLPSRLEGPDLEAWMPAVVG
jgi:hypothetical protein